VNPAFICTVGIWTSIAVCALLSASCGRVGGTQGDVEEKTARVTVWSERFEIFLEHRLIVTNSPTKFITHVSDLLTLESRREGPVPFALRPGSGAPLTHIDLRPARDGIYTPELTFPAPGEWRVSLLIPLSGEDYTVDLPPSDITQRSSGAPAPREPWSDPGN
jgi:hypothetical protein